ncbi:hypothetical protein CRG98_005444, partial [Punica granatum]
AYNGDDYNGTRIVSRAHELRDSVHGMISQMDPALLTFCDKIAAQGGPLQLPDDLAASTFPSIPVVQLGTVTRASARLRNVQPQLNLDQSNDVLKRSTADDNLRTQDSLTPKPPNEEEVNDALNTERQEPSPAESNPEEPPEGGTPDCADGGRNSPHASVMDIDVSGQVESIKRLFVERTDNYVIPQLERLYTRVIKGVFETRKEGKDDLKQRILSFLSKFAEDEGQILASMGGFSPALIGSIDVGYVVLVFSPLSLLPAQDELIAVINAVDRMLQACNQFSYHHCFHHDEPHANSSRSGHLVAPTASTMMNPMQLCKDQFPYHHCFRREPPSHCARSITTTVRPGPGIDRSSEYPTKVRYRFKLH